MLLHLQVSQDEDAFIVSFDDEDDDQKLKSPTVPSRPSSAPPLPRPAAGKSQVGGGAALADSSQATAPLARTRTQPASTKTQPRPIASGGSAQRLGSGAPGKGEVGAGGVGAGPGETDSMADMRRKLAEQEREMQARSCVRRLLL